jgi:hypothetical protein
MVQLEKNSEFLLNLFVSIYNISCTSEIELEKLEVNYRKILE